MLTLAKQVKPLVCCGECTRMSDCPFSDGVKVVNRGAFPQGPGPVKPITWPATAPKL